MSEETSCEKRGLMRRIFLVQIGTPKSCDEIAIREFLKAFLNHPLMVVPRPKLWWLILHLFILRKRPKYLLPRYEKLWEIHHGNPLRIITNKLASKIQALLTPDTVVSSLILFDEKDRDQKLSEITSEDKVVFIPLFPQYSGATTGIIEHDLLNLMPNFISHFEERFFDNKFYIDGSANKILSTLSKSEVDLLVISFHSYPIERLEKENDPYHREVVATFELIKNKVQSQLDIEVHLAYQSKMGRGKWLSPDLEDFCIDEVIRGKREIAVYPAGFFIDCLETTIEIDVELRSTIKAAGGELTYISPLNDDDSLAQTILSSINTYL